jgi:putative salt-induced outer membrane protein YdiY
MPKERQQSARRPNRRKEERRSNMQRFYVAMAALILWGAVVRADEVLLTNGDRLTGTIVKMTDGKLAFQSPAAGDVTIPVTDVQTLTSVGSVTLVLSDGTVLIRKLRPGQSGQIVIEAEGALGAQVIPLGSVTAINPPPKPEPKWTGSISAGLTATTGNTKTEAINASVDVQRRGEKDRMTAGFDYARGKQRDRDTGEDNVTEDWWRTRARYDYFFFPKTFGFMNVRYERDSIAELDRRVVLGGGGGYQFVESEKLNLAGLLGLASLYEKFKNETDSKSEFSAQAGYNLDMQVNDGITILHDLSYFPSLEKFSDYFLTTSGEVRASLMKSMFASFKVIFSYDESPAIGRGSTDVKYMLSVGLTF